MRKVLLGDSLFEYMGCDSRYENYSVAGSTVNDVLYRLLDVDIKDADVYLLVGINDLLSGSSIDVLKASYLNLIENILEKQVNSLTIVSLLPLTYDFGLSHLLNSFVVDFNLYLQNRVKEYSLEFVDIHKHLLCEGYLCDELSDDGIHLSPKGYEIFKQHLGV